MKLELINSEYRFSFYDNLFRAGLPDGEMTINELIECIKYGYLSDEINYLRGLEGEAYKDFKKQLPGVTTSGIFDRRIDSAIVEHSGLIQVDIDHTSNYDLLFSQLCRDPYVYVCFRSPGGKGIKAIVKILPQAETHEDQFRALSSYFMKMHGVEIDRHCRNVSRCMLLSHDPSIYCNPFSEVFELSEKLQPESKRDERSFKTETNQVSSDGNRNAILSSILDQVKATGTDLTSTYSDWIKIGFALCSEFGEDGRSAFHALSANYPEYSERQTDTLYSQLMKKSTHRTTMGSLVYLARLKGLKVEGWRSPGA